MHTSNRSSWGKSSWYHYLSPYGRATSRSSPQMAIEVEYILHVACATSSPAKTEKQTSKTRNHPNYIFCFKLLFYLRTPTARIYEPFIM